MPTWEVQLLGELRLTQGDQTITRFRTRPVDSIFAYLALHLGQQIRREHLMELGWPSRETASSQQNLRTALNNIRNLLGPDTLEATRSAVRLNPQHFTVDAREFKQTKNLALYNGRLLGDTAPEWVTPHAQELEELYTSCLLQAMGEAPAAQAIAMGNDAVCRFPTLVAIRSKLRELDPLAQRKTPLAAPYIVNSFIGRKNELETLQRTLQSNRLVTLVGLGGAGKTRIAAELWSLNQPESWFVPLVDLPDSRGIGDAIRQALRLPVSAGRTGLEQAISNLTNADGLLILDNFEHVVDGASMVSDLLTNCPNLHIVVTSRVPLRILGESELPVGSLAVSSDTDAHLSESELLFEARARAAFPGFEITHENRAAVTELCIRLDGFPLSIELAAAKSRVFTPREMLTQLDDRFEFLTQAGGGTRRRQASLLDALDWSFDRLDRPEQSLLCKLSIFEGGFTLDAAVKVCGTSPSGTQIESLLTAAWIERAHSTGDTRFRMLESVKEYGRALLKPKERMELDAAHAQFFVALATKCFDTAFSPAEEPNFRQVRDDEANIESAYSWLRDNDPEGSLRLATGLSWFWALSGVPHIGEARVCAALEHVSEKPTRLLAAAYHSNGTSTMNQGKFEESLVWHKKANEAAAAAQYDLYLGLSYLQIGRYHAELGIYEAGPEYVALGVQVLTKEENVSWGSTAYVVAALLANRAGDAPGAIAAGELAVKLARQGGYQWGLASALNEVAMACHLAGHYEESIQYQKESIELKQQSLTPASLALSYADLAATHLALGQLDQATLAIKEWARLLVLLNDLENYPRGFAIAAEMFARSCNFEMARACLSNFLLVKRDHHVCASEALAYESAMFVVGTAVASLSTPHLGAIFDEILAM